MICNNAKCHSAGHFPFEISYMCFSKANTIPISIPTPLTPLLYMSRGRVGKWPSNWHESLAWEQGRKSTRYCVQTSSWDLLQNNFDWHSPWPLKVTIPHESIQWRPGYCRSCDHQISSKAWLTNTPVLMRTSHFLVRWMGSQWYSWAVLLQGRCV